jgi:hypothetical protein
MFPNDFRRIALAQGLLCAGEQQAPPRDPAPSPEAKPAARAPEPCEERDDAV